MNSTDASSSEAAPFVPKFAPFDLSRLDIIDPIPTRGRVQSLATGPPDWEIVHSMIQGIFGRMAARIRARWPMIVARGGRSSARSYDLYSYMTFGLTDDDSMECVIVGLNFEPISSGDAVRLCGDIGGEESGRIDFELEERSVALTPSEVIPIALDMARRLSEQAELIAKNVLERHPVPEY